MRIVRRVSEEANWQQVQKLVDEDSIYVGDQVEDFINNVPMTFEVAHVTDEGALFVSKEVWPEYVRWNREWTNKGGFKESNVCRFLNEELFNILPEDLQQVISEREVLQITDEREERYPLKLWLPTEYEVFGEDSWCHDESEGQQFDLFRDKRNRVKCSPDGDRADWWLLSAYSWNSTVACFVDYYGHAYYGATSAELRVPVCFQIKKKS